MALSDEVGVAPLDKDGVAPAWVHHNRELTLGRLTPALAHDFNNLLVAVLGNASILGSEVQADHPWAELISGIVAASERAAGLNRHLLDYARRSVRPVSLMLEQVTAKALELGRCAAPPRVLVQFEARGETGRITADSGRVCQIILNVLLAAGEVLPAGGQLRVSAVRGPGPAGGSLAGRSCEWLQFDLTPRGQSPVEFETLETRAAAEPPTGGEVGLASARALLRALGGELEFSTSAGGEVSIRACFGPAEP